MSIIDSITLIGIMAVLAVIPSTSVALVVVRSATSGIENGIAVTTGIVLGDIVFVMLAVFGLSILSETMGSLFMIVKYLGAIYLICLGISLVTAKNGMNIKAYRTSGKGSLLTSFMAGLSLTLGDIKAIVFYMSLFPMFIGVDTLQSFEIFTILAITIISVGGVKLAYALSAVKIASKAVGFRFEKLVSKTAGSFMVGAGSYIVLKS